jgi:hypothetical protein
MPIDFVHVPILVFLLLLMHLQNGPERLAARLIQQVHPVVISIYTTRELNPMWPALPLPTIVFGCGQSIGRTGALVVNG